MLSSCASCKKRLLNLRNKFCSNKCQSNYQYTKYLDKWKKGIVTGNRGINTKNISRHIRRYLIDKFGEICSICKWDKIHPVTHYVPLEIDHIDGNGENNNEDNLRLLCPNCHALTPNFRNLNKGNGRIWRKNKYKRINSKSDEVKIQ